MKKRFLACLLTAVMLVTATVSPVWAAPGGSGGGSGGNAQVTVKNVKGGLLAVGVKGERTLDFIPVGTTVDVPVGTELEIFKDTISYDTDDGWVRTYLKTLSITKDGEMDVENQYTYNGQGVFRGETYTVQGDTVIDGEFGAVVRRQEEDMDELYLYLDDVFPAPMKLNDVKIYADYTSGNQYQEVDSKNISMTITEVEYYSASSGQMFTPEDFSISNGKISSRGELPMGSYTILIKCVYQGNIYEENYLDFNVGYEAGFGVTLGKFKDGNHTSYLDRISYIWDENDNDYLDGRTTTFADALGYLNNFSETFGIYGYERSAWTDDDGNSVAGTKTLAELSPRDSRAIFYGVYKKNGTAFKPATISRLDAILREGWVKENNKWYYYENGEPVTNTWKESNGSRFYLGEDGAMATNGIAGTGDERYLVDTEGKIREDFNGTYEDEKEETVYDITAGKVTGEHILVATPSNADRLTSLADKLIDGYNTIPEEDKPGLVDKLLEGVEKLSKKEKEKLTEQDIKKLDQAVNSVFTNIHYQADIDTGEFTGDDAIPAGGEEMYAGMLAAAGLRSSMMDDEVIDIRIVTTQKATKSNADKYTEEVRFEVTMYVNDSEVEPKSPLLMKIPMTGRFVASYNNATRSYKAVHEKDDGTKETTLNPDLGEDGSVFIHRAYSFSEFAISSTKKTSRPNSGGSSRSTSMSGASGKWVKDDTGWWFSYYGGGYPAAKWELIAGKWYYFGSSGYMLTGWQEIQGRWFYLDPVNGDMKTGWMQDRADGYWYYLSLKTGAMKTGWQEIDGQWYYLNPLPAVKEGQGQVQGGKTRPLGSMYRNEATPDGYQVGESGALVK